MRTLKQIIKLTDGVRYTHGTEILALDENGELWFGALEATDDARRVVNWTPVNTPKDGAGYSEPQLSFFDKWEKEAHERIQAEAERLGKDVSLAAEKPDHTAAISGSTGRASDDRVEDGEGTDPVDG